MAKSYKHEESKSSTRALQIKPDEKVEDQVRGILRSMGCSTIYSGYELTVTAVCMIAENTQWLHQICALYATVGEKENMPQSRVERNIRYVNHTLWNSKIGREKMVELAGVNLTRQPTTGRFLEILSFGVHV